VAGAGDARREQTRGDCEDADDACEQPAALERGSQSPLAQWQVHANGQHQHREADFCQERDRAVRRIDGIKHGRSNEDAGEDLADDDGHEAASGDPEQRATETGEHDHHERAEAHRHTLPALCVGCSGVRTATAGWGPGCANLRCPRLDSNQRPSD
jgi:hypothetical protein